ncbi:hypothetical protein [Sphingobium lignivorans]|uniref:Uncharacterized protein n=1 Tax=Sphingobium lignivorans TaxID=2735886 RepID=A0ABR6NMI0_9SPHN|nr:hypothetical protein [Sphingobium lignivorans]MBB5987399.1 hypothetical protein [Sphingobium lignivorans]
MTKRTCPAAGCISWTAPGKFMCRPHWFGLPKPLRDEVWRTWRIIESATHRRAEPEQRLADIRAYRAACAAAEAWWND